MDVQQKAVIGSMIKYEIIVQRNLVQEATFIVEGPDRGPDADKVREDAKRIALELAQSGDENIAWTATDGEYEISEVSICAK
jgi:hypothetical protein